MTWITQTFLNYKFEIVYFKAGGWMGVEEAKGRKTKGSGPGELWGSCSQSALPDFEVEE